MTTTKKTKKPAQEPTIFSKPKRSLEQTETNYHLQKVISDFMLSFLEDGEAGEAGENLLEKWNSQEVQDQLVGMVKFHLPKKPKVLKDPNAPKKPRTSYILFCKENREQIKTDFPDLKGTSITKKLGDTWTNNMTNKDKEKYIKESEKDKKRYAKEMKKYVPLTQSQLEELHEQKQQEKQEKQENKGVKGKRAPTAYNLFSKEKRAEVKEEHPEMKGTDVTKVVGQMWKLQTDKTKWVDLASGGKTVKEKPKKMSPGKKLGKPKKGQQRMSGMVLFSREERLDLQKRFPDLTSEQLVQRIRKLWNDLEDDEREAYEDRAREEV
jgi:upstream-binding transcription factor